MGKRMEVINPKAKWIQKVKTILKKLNNGEIKNFPLISREEFEGANSNEQIRLLRGKLGDILKTANIPLDRNMLCPLHLDHSPSLMYNKEKSDLHCFGCMEPGETRDVFDLISLLLRKSSFIEQKFTAIEILVEDGKEITENMRIKKSSNYTNSSCAKMDFPNSARKSFSATKTNNRIYIPAWEDPDCMRYIAERGITFESAKKFNLRCWTYQNKKYLVIMCDDRFQTRRIFKGDSNGYGKYWNKGEVSLFNSKRLDEALEDESIFLVESALDAILIEQLGYKAIAINGVNNYSKILGKADVIRSKDLHIIVLFDNDKSGLNSSIKMYKEVLGEEIDFYMHKYSKIGVGSFLYRFKDITEAYVDNREETLKAIGEIYHMGSYVDISESSLTNEEIKAFSEVTASDLAAMYGGTKVIFK